MWKKSTDENSSMCQQSYDFYRFGCDCILTFLRAESIKLWQHLGQSGRKNIMFQQGFEIKIFETRQIGRRPWLNKMYKIKIFQLLKLKGFE